MFNLVLHHFGLSLKIETNQQLEYYFYEPIPDWIIKCPWYNISICKKLHGTVFEYIYIRNERTKRDIIICSIDAH